MPARRAASGQLGIVMHLAALRMMERRARILAAVGKAFTFTGEQRDRVRRSAVADVVATALGLRPWQRTNAFYLEVTELLREKGWGLINPYNVATFVGAKPVSDTRDARDMCDKPAAHVPTVPKVAQPKPGSKEFERLRREWYARADPLGEDIEDPRDPDRPLSSKGTVQVREQDDRSRGRSAEQIADRAQFIVDAERFLDAYRFRDARDRSIWQDVCRGKPVRDISLQLRMRKGDVCKTIRRLKEALRLWLEDNAE